MRSIRPSDLFYVLAGRLVQHVLRGYFRYHMEHSRGRIAAAGFGGVVVGVIAGAAWRRRAGGGAVRGA